MLASGDKDVLQNALRSCDDCIDVTTIVEAVSLSSITDFHVDDGMIIDTIPPLVHHQCFPFWTAALSASR
jgi:hypothetical protein